MLLIYSILFLIVCSCRKRSYINVCYKLSSFEFEHILMQKQNAFTTWNIPTLDTIWCQVALHPVYSRRTAPHVCSSGSQTVSDLTDARGSQGKLWQPVCRLFMGVNDLHHADVFRVFVAFSTKISQHLTHTQTLETKHTLLHELR